MNLQCVCGGGGGVLHAEEAAWRGTSRQDTSHGAHWDTHRRLSTVEGVASKVAETAWRHRLKEGFENAKAVTSVWKGGWEAESDADEAVGGLLQLDRSACSRAGCHPKRGVGGTPCIKPPPIKTPQEVLSIWNFGVYRAGFDCTGVYYSHMVKLPRVGLPVSRPVVCTSHYGRYCAP